MNASKNVGRKRLGRLPISGGSIGGSGISGAGSGGYRDKEAGKKPRIGPNHNHGVQHVAFAEAKKPTPAAAEPHPELMDLSFSTSFGGDDFMSAVDKLERDYGNTETNRTKTGTNVGNVQEKDNHIKVATKSAITKQTCVSSVQSLKHTDKHEVASKPKVKVKESVNSDNGESSIKSRQEVPLTAKVSNRHNVEIKEDQTLNPKTEVVLDKIKTSAKARTDDNNHTAKSGSAEAFPKVRACQLRTETKENMKSTPKSEIGCRKSRLSITSSFLMSPDISFTSPQGVSTPQITPESNHSKQKRSNPFSKPGLSAIVKAKNEIKKHKGKLAGNKKDLIEVTPVRTKDVTKSNKSDFFKSLFMDKSSDISISPDVTDKILVDKTPELVDPASAKNVHVNKASGRAEKHIQDVQALRKKAETSSNMNMKSLKDSTEIDKEGREKMTVLAEDSRSNINDGARNNINDTARNNTNEAAMKSDKTEDKTTEMEGDRGSDLADMDKNENNGHTPHRSTADTETVLHSNIASGGSDLCLSSWGLPETVLKQYNSRGITHMFPWQAECLQMGNVLGGGNLVYSAPTSAGKTMVAELLVLKRVLETRKKALIILPFVSVTREKMFYLQELYQDAGIRVSGFMGHYAPAGGFSNVDVAVCTIEKGNGLINRLLEENKLDKLGIIVVDELHLLGDSHRGYLLELMLTKICYMGQKTTDKQADMTPDHNVQIIGMSATLPNLDLLAAWLNADLYRTDYRPVPLTECFKMGTALYDSGLNLLRDIDTTYTAKGDDDHVVPLCIETIREGHSILIFCPTKNWCEKLSETVARELYNLLKNPQVAVPGKAGDNAGPNILVLPLVQSTLRDIVEQLRRTPVGLDSVLGRTVPFGVAYHHAGLTFDERDIVEGAFRQGILKVLIATSTLSSGVNLPARRVLIRTPVFHGQLIDFLTYKQMIGRAGRKGVDTAGESILLCKPNEKPKALALVKGALPAVQSTLIRNEGDKLSSSMKRAILEVVVSGIAMAPKDVALYASCTLLAASVEKETDKTQDLIDECIQFLQENEFVCCQKVTENGETVERFVPTQLGSAVLASSLGPDEGLKVFAELQKARQCFVLENELHIIYLVTPIYAVGIGDSIDWYQYFCLWETLPTGMKRVAELVGVKESFLAKAVRGRILSKTDAQLKLVGIHKRFYTALVLHDLVHEMALSEVVRKYNCNKGQLQSLQQSAATFAGMVTVFCARLGWSNLELILSQFQNRLTFGVQRELCDLVRLSSLNGQRARVFYNGGYQTVAAIASATTADVEALLKNSAPFQSNKRQDTETEWEADERRKTRCIFLTGRKGVTESEAAQIIIEEAKALIQEELGGLGIQWSAKAPVPEIKSPVVTSPVQFVLDLVGNSEDRFSHDGTQYVPVSARVPQSKKKQQQGNRRSSLTRKSTSPGTGKSMNTSPKEGSNSKPPVLCVISPPPLKQKDKDLSNGNNQVKEPNKGAATCSMDRTESEQEKGNTHAALKSSINNQSKTIDPETFNKEVGSKENNHHSLIKEQTNPRLKGDENGSKKRDEKAEKISSKEAGDVAETKDKAKHPTEHNTGTEGNCFTKSLSKPVNSVTNRTENMVTQNKFNSEKDPDEKNKTSDIVNVDSANDKQLESKANKECNKGKQTTAATFTTIESKHSGHTVIVTKATIEKQPVNSNESNCERENPKELAGEKAVSKSAERKAKMKSVQFSEGPVAVISTPVKYAKLDNQKGCIGVSVCLKDRDDKNLSKNIESSHQHQHKSQESPVQTESNGSVLKNNDVTHLDSDKIQLQSRNTLENNLKPLSSEPKQVIKCSKKGVSDATLHKAFNDSFIIDSQTDIIDGSQKELENNQKDKTNGVLVKTGTHSKNTAKSVPNTAHNFLKDCLHSESLFSQDDLYCSFNTSLEYFPAADKDMNKNTADVINSDTSDSGNANSSLNAVDKINRSNTQELFTDRNKSTEESVVSENDLELNVSESGIDTSMDLIAASNYDRIACSSVSVMVDQEANDSYADLHIPYQSGQELCFENLDHQKPGNTDKNHQEIGILGNLMQKSENDNVLGQFSSPKPVNLGGKYNENDLQEDLAIALEMGDSFCSTFSTQAESKDKNYEKAKPPVINSNKGDMGDSLTFSMMEKVLDDDQNVDSENSKLTYNEFKSKQICDIVQKSNLSRLISDNSHTTLNKAKSVITYQNSSQDSKAMSKSCDRNQVMKENDISPGTLSVLNNMDDSFLTPTCKSAPKRAKNTQGCRAGKSQKMQAAGYSTPEALKTDKKRTRGKQNSSDKQEQTRKRSVERQSNNNDDVNKRGKKLRKFESPGNNEIENMRDSLGNTSTESDYVPPTPPDESQLCVSPFRQPRTPRGSLRVMSPFSPKLRNSKTIDVKSQKKDKTTRLDKNNMKKSQTEVSKQKSPNISKSRRKSPNTESKTSETSNSKKQSAKIDIQFGYDIKNAKPQVRNEVKKKSIQITSNTQEENDKNAYESENGDKDGDDNEKQGDSEDDNDENLPASFLDLNESGIPLTQSSFTIIDVCADKRLLKTFIMEWRTKTRYAMALACEKRPEAVASGSGIGGKFQKGSSPTKRGEDSDGIVLDDRLVLVGVAISWENRDAYYIALTHQDPQGDPNDSLAPPPSDPDISFSIRQKAIKSVLQQERCKDDDVTMFIFDVKSQYRALVRGLGFPLKGRFEDPRIACWLLDPGAKEKNLHRMVTNLLPTEVHLLHGIGGGIGYGSIGMSPQNPGSGRYRATTECVLVRHLAEYFRACLVKDGLYKSFCNVEMPAAVSLCRMELNGFGFSQEECESQKNVMTAKLSALEEQAYLMIGHPFSLSAPEDIAQLIHSYKRDMLQKVYSYMSKVISSSELKAHKVLFIELQLPPNGDPNAAPAARSLASRGRGGPRRGRQKCQFSTSKEVLEKLKKFHPLPGLILEWRRITNALTKVVFPLQKEKVLCSQLEMYRIFCECQLHSATGRVSLSEPNLQNIPKDFEIKMPDMIGESPPANLIGRQTRAGKSKLQQLIGQQPVARVTDDSSASMFSVSMRHAFVPFKGGVLLAADYSQLELRMIAHLSKDEKLIKVLNEDGDVFKMITAQWKNIPVEEVTAEQRAQAKQVCYGMIYGIGPKALGEQLEVDENDAAAFIETFKAKYPGMRKFLRTTVDSCREKGYVQTMLGRKRYLQAITGTNPHARAQAERQAINTTVQGSAADLVKMAMVEIDQRLMTEFPDCQATHNQKFTDKKFQKLCGPPHGGYLVLQLHDELIYEVNKKDVNKVAAIIKDSMENAMKLPVKMPVKVKVGPSWGKLEEI